MRRDSDTGEPSGGSVGTGGTEQRGGAARCAAGRASAPDSQRPPPRLPQAHPRNRRVFGVYLIRVVATTRSGQGAVIRTRPALGRSSPPCGRAPWFTRRSRQRVMRGGVWPMTAYHSLGPDRRSGPSTLQTPRAPHPPKLARSRGRESAVHGGGSPSVRARARRTRAGVRLWAATFLESGPLRSGPPLLSAVRDRVPFLSRRSRSRRSPMRSPAAGPAISASALLGGADTVGRSWPCPTGPELDQSRRR